MCRLAAYIGPPTALENVVIRPSHSLLAQSTEALEAKLAVNGDGFGLAWYGAHPEPGQYRDTPPAWSDGNLLSLCRHIVSPLFLAHVRASTSGETARANCHPFVHGRWSFMHNGQIGRFDLIRRALEADLADGLYAARRGTTDSELLFLMLLNEGLDRDPSQAFERVLTKLYSTYAERQMPVFLRLTCVFSDGDTLYSFRHASDGLSPTLYVSDSLLDGGVVLASEPLNADAALWKRIDPDQVSRHEVSYTRLTHA